MVLTSDELNRIEGGGAKLGFFIALGGLITLVVGIIDGYLRPLSCNRK